MNNLIKSNDSEDQLRYLSIQLTKQCNCDCKFCGQAISRVVRKEKNEMDRERISEIIEDSRKLGVNLIIYTGGEPTLRRDLPEIIKETSSSGIEVNLCTNGYLLEKEYCDRLVQSGLSQLSLSFHSPKEKIHDKICAAKGSFNHLNKAVKYLKIIKPTIKIGAAYTINSLNYHDSYRMLLLAKELGIDFISFSHTVFSHYLIDDSLRLSKEQMHEFYFKITPLLLKGGAGSKVKIDINPFFQSLSGKSIRDQILTLINHSDSFDKEISFYLKGEYSCGLHTTSPCFTSSHSSRIMADGNVVLCCDSELGELNLGNINEQRFFDIWNSKRYKELRNINHYPKGHFCSVCRNQFSTIDNQTAPET